MRHFNGKACLQLGESVLERMPKSDSHYAVLSPSQRQRVFFGCGVDPLSNVSAGTELQVTTESAGPSARYHSQDGRHPGETIFSELLSGVACGPCATVKMTDKSLRFSDVQG